MPAVNILSVIRQGAGAMQPLLATGLLLQLAIVMSLADVVGKLLSVVVNSCVAFL